MMIAAVQLRRVAAFGFHHATKRTNTKRQLPKSPHHHIRTSAILRLASRTAASTTAVKQQVLQVVRPPAHDNKTTKKRPFHLVIVESPSKCSTISKILQEYVKENKLAYDFVITSCMGHVRDLQRKVESKEQTIAGVDLREGTYEPKYELLPYKKTLMTELQDLSSQAEELILATDDDREGEAMAWHLQEILVHQQQPPIKKKPPNVQRVRFQEITKKAIQEAIANPSSLRDGLVQAQETRRILDRLAGYTVSPLLWRKIAPGLSAGRVQSVGMALVVQRERERLLFQETEYWDMDATFKTEDGVTFTTSLFEVDGQRVASGTGDFESNIRNKLSAKGKDKLHLKESDAHQLVAAAQSEEIATWTVKTVTSREKKFKPSPPFITSSIQQEANTRLSLSVSQTMQCAQKLYENGFISYMRTDSTRLSDDAQAAIFQETARQFGEDAYEPRVFAEKKSKKKVKKPEAQAAHEAIRPAVQSDGGFLDPLNLPSTFDSATQSLYELIYQRTIASQMVVQRTKQTTSMVEGTAGDHVLSFRASGSVVISPGFTMMYPRVNDSSQPLPSLSEEMELGCESVSPLRHSSQPPARYTEASFVETLETLGVGRPSTYASVVKVLRDRAYVGSPPSGNGTSRRRKEVSGPAISAKRAAGGDDFTGSANARGPMVPSLTAFVVCSLLENRCPTYVDPAFTAKMEERLDLIADSEVSQTQRVAYLEEFYGGDSGLAATIERMDQEVQGTEARRVRLPTLNGTNEEAGLFVGPWGPYVQRESSEDEKAVSVALPPGMSADISTITQDALDILLKSKEENGVILGEHPDDSRAIRLRTGRFGAYLQWGDDNEDGTTTHTLPPATAKMKNIDIAAMEGTDFSLPDLIGVTLDDAIQYVNLPRTICTLNDLPIVGSIGPYGPYLKYNNTFMSLLARDGSVLTIEADDAEKLVLDGIVNGSKKKARNVLAELGEKEGKTVTVKTGRFGTYINWKKTNAKLPVAYEDDPSSLPFEEACALIEEKLSKPVMTKKKKKGAKSEASVDLPPAPKRPLSAYLHFCAETRPEVAGNFNSLAETSKELGRRWKEADAAQVERFAALATEGKEAYAKAKVEWEQVCDEILAKSESKPVRKNSKKRKTSTSKGAKKKATNAYIVFCSEHRPTIVDDEGNKLPLGETSRRLSSLWKSCDEEEKAKYKQKALELQSS